jgi:hypothetical protein
MTRPLRTHERIYRRRTYRRTPRRSPRRSPGRSLRRRSSRRSNSPREYAKKPITPATRTDLVKFLSGHTAELLGTTALATTGLVGKQVIESVNKYVSKFPPMYVVIPKDMCIGYLLINTFQRKVICDPEYITTTSKGGGISRLEKTTTKSKGYDKYKNETLTAPIPKELIDQPKELIEQDSRARFFIYSNKNKLKAYTNVMEFAADLKTHNVFLEIPSLGVYFEYEKPT